MSRKLELISTYTCPYVQRARILMNEKGADYDITYIDLANKPDWFKEIAPMGTVPVLRITDKDSGQDTTLFESQVICEYLDETVEPRLHPSDPLDKAFNRAWIEFASKLISAVAGYTFSQDEDAMKEKIENMEKLLTRLEQTLADRDHDGPFFNGETYHLIDAEYAPFFTRFYVLEKHYATGLLEKFPKVKAYGDVLMNRKSTINSTVDTLDEEMKKRIEVRNGVLSKYFN